MLPLQGYFRPGRCLPVLIQANPTGLRIEADGAVPAEIHAGQVGLIPVLILSNRAGQLHVGTQRFALRPLAADQSLVAVIGSADKSVLAAELFPGRQIIAIRLDPSDELVGPAIALESLDALIVDGNWPRWLANYHELVAAGVTIISSRPERPDSLLPWQRSGKHWIVRYEPAGPTATIGGEEAYLPAQGWQPGHAPSFRRQVVMAAALATLILMSTLLIRSRNWSLAALIAATVTCTAAIEWWRRSQPPFRSAGGSIFVVHDGLVQHDAWKYVAAARPANGSQAVDSLVRPVLVDLEHARRVDLLLDCKAQDTMSWKYRLDRQTRLAFFRRSVGRFPERPATRQDSDSPLQWLARRCYLRQGWHIAGQISQKEQWPAVVIDTISSR